MPTYKCTGCEMAACTITISLDDRNPADLIANFVCPVYGEETKCANLVLEDAEQYGLRPNGMKLPSEEESEDATGRTVFLNNSKVINRLDLWIHVAKKDVKRFEDNVKTHVAYTFEKAWIYSLNDNATNEYGMPYTTVHMWIYGDLWFGQIRKLLDLFSTSYSIFDITGSGYMCFWPEYYDDDDPDVVPDDDREPVSVRMVDISTEEITEVRFYLRVTKLHYSIFEYIRDGYTDFNDAQTVADALSGVLLDFNTPAPVVARVQLTRNTVNK